ncbi:MAG: 23S rRNA (adenine(2503)-C(2))-methyltransferase RlmN [Pseudomonadales bacterium]
MIESPINLFDLTRTQMEAFTAAIDDKPYRTHQMMKWAYHRRQLDFSAMTNLSKAFRSWLQAHAEYRLPEVVARYDSVDGTVKWVIRIAGANCVETVLIPDRGRNTLCVSSQVGCMLDCRFCSTGKQGFDGNLSAGEIVAQVWLANQMLAERGEVVTNVVLMGMGEPLLNFDAVTTAVDLMMDDLAFGISKRRVTVSTAGVVPAIYQLAEVTDVSLAISLHAPTDKLRDELVPLNRKYPIQALLDACRHYVAGLGENRSLTMEYTLLKGVNDDLSHARELAALLRDVRCKINLIPFNPFPASGFERPEPDRVRRFQTQLIDAGYSAMLRTTRGEDIAAACGQLIGRVSDRTRRHQRYLARVRAADEQITPKEIA